MKETHTDWYYRSRTDLLKSMFDGFDFRDSIANFYFAKMNLSNHGQVISKSTLDDVCDSILKNATGEKTESTLLKEGQR